MAVAVDVTPFIRTRDRPELEEITKVTEEHGLLEKLDGVLTKWKEKLRVTGQTVKQNKNLILLAGFYATTYINIVALVAQFSFDGVYHPEHFAKFPLLAKSMPIPIERAYTAIGVTAAAILPVWTMGLYNIFDDWRAT